MSAGAIDLAMPPLPTLLTMMLSRRGVSRFKMMLVQLGFALMVPTGAFLFILTRGSIAAKLQTQLVGAALSFAYFLTGRWKKKAVVKYAADGKRTE